MFTIDISSTWSSSFFNEKFNTINSKSSSCSLSGEQQPTIALLFFSERISCTIKTFYPFFFQTKHRCDKVRSAAEPTRDPGSDSPGKRGGRAAAGETGQPGRRRGHQDRHTRRWLRHAWVLGKNFLSLSFSRLIVHVGKLMYMGSLSILETLNGHFLLEIYEGHLTRRAWTKF